MTKPTKKPRVLERNRFAWYDGDAVFLAGRYATIEHMRILRLKGERIVRVTITETPKRRKVKP